MDYRNYSITTTVKIARSLISSTFSLKCVILFYKYKFLFYIKTTLPALYYFNRTIMISKKTMQVVILLAERKHVKVGIWTLDLGLSCQLLPTKVSWTNPADTIDPDNLLTMTSDLLFEKAWQSKPQIRWFHPGLKFLYLRFTLSSCFR